jgi:hypothetical protein
MAKLTSAELDDRFGPKPTSSTKGDDSRTSKMLLMTEQKRERKITENTVLDSDLFARSYMTCTWKKKSLITNKQTVHCNKTDRAGA